MPSRPRSTPPRNADPIVRMLSTDFALPMVVAVALAVSTLTPLLAHAADGVREVAPAYATAGGATPGDAPGFPITLSQPGSYVLTGSIVTSGADVAIEITADDVSLDLNGHAVECRAFLSLLCTGNVGIDGAGRTNVRIENGSVMGHGSYGMFLGDGAHVRDVRAIGNGGSGILVGEESIVESSAAFDNGTNGIVTGRVSVVTRNVAARNGEDGFIVNVGSTVLANTASENGEDGFAVGFSSVVAENASRNNTGDGFDLGLLGGTSNINGGRARDNVSESNDGFGLRMDSPWGYSGNVLHSNNGGNANPQLSGGIAMGLNVCGGDTICP